MLDFMVQALEGIFTIVFVVGIGYYLSYKKWFDDRSSKLIARLVTSVSLPLYMITSLTKNFTFEKLLKLAPDMLLPICSILLAMVIGLIAAKAFKVTKGRRGIFVTNFFIANTMFIGLPVNLALFGDISIPSVMLYYMVNLISFWTLGVHFIISDNSDESKSVFSLDVLKKLWTPPLIGFVVALLLIVVDIHLPKFLMRGFQYVGNLTTPLFIGFMMNFVCKKEQLKNIGLVIFSFGILFEGIEIMGSVMKPLATSAIFVDLMAKVKEIPILGVALGTIMTLVVQSSSATIAVLQNFAAQPGWRS